MKGGQVLHLPEGILVKLSGIGARQAHLAAEVLVENRATALLSWGIAGGLQASLSAGSLILPERVLSYDQSTFSADAAWHERLCTRLSEHLDLNTGPLVQSPTVISTPAEKIALSKKSGAVAVDMESASVAQVAARARIPFMAIRAICDPVNATIPANARIAINEGGRLQPLRLIQSTARHPQEFIRLVRLARGFRTARTTLATVLLHTGPNLLAP
jgi:adenosylhomocysteine nucleosidase